MIMITVKEERKNQVIFSKGYKDREKRSKKKKKRGEMREKEISHVRGEGEARAERRKKGRWGG